jgi:SET domain-containing protein
VFYNHCCDGNCGFGSLDSGTIIAVKDIEAGEELTYDYQLMDVEPTMYNIQNCKCCSNRCRGRIDFSTYRQIDWQLEKYEYAGYFIKKRIDDLKTKWYSSRCYLKYNKEKTQLGLASLRQLNKDELVAIYFDKENVNQDSHYIRQAVNGSDANLYLDKNGHCYAKHAIEANTFLTLDFNIL